VVVVLATGAGGETEHQIVGPGVGREIDREHQLGGAAAGVLHVNRELIGRGDGNCDRVERGGIRGIDAARERARAGQISVVARRGTADRDRIGIKPWPTRLAFVGIGEIAVGIEADVQIAAAQAGGRGGISWRVTQAAAISAGVEAAGFAGIEKEERDAVGPVAAITAVLKSAVDGSVGGGERLVAVDVGRFPRVCVGQAQCAIARGRRRERRNVSCAGRIGGGPRC